MGDAAGDPDWYGYCLEDLGEGECSLGLMDDFRCRPGVDNLGRRVYNVAERGAGASPNGSYDGASAPGEPHEKNRAFSHHPGRHRAVGLRQQERLSRHARRQGVLRAHLPGGDGPADPAVRRRGQAQGELRRRTRFLPRVFLRRSRGRNLPRHGRDPALHHHGGPR